MVVLDAAREYLSSADLVWSRVLTYDKLEEISGLDRAQIAKDFDSKDELSRRLAQHCLGSHPSNIAWLVEALEAVPGQCRDPLTTLEDVVRLLGAVSQTEMQSDEVIHAQLAVWGLASKGENRDDLREMYSMYDDVVEIGVQHFFDYVEESGRYLRPGIDVRNVSTALNSLSQGLRIRSTVDPEAVPAGMTGTFFVLLLSAMIADYPNPEPIGENLKGL